MATENPTTGVTEATAISPTPMPMTPEELVQGDLVAYGEAPPDKRAQIEKCLAELEMDDANSIIFFGAKAQKQLTTISDHMLEGVRNKDVGPAGNALNLMLTTLRGFDVEGLDPRLEPSWIEKIFGFGKPVAKFLQRYEEVRDQIERIGDELENHKTKLMTDIASLDRLYEANLDYFHTLADYIAAGEEKLRALDQEIIPALHQKAEASGEVLAAQELRDLRSARDDLERRVHDLKLTRQVAMQSLPSIRLVQENDKSLLTKINSTMANTIPLWRQQLAQAVTIHRSNQASKTLKSATDLTNELLTANAENLKQANAEIRREVERGVFDIEVVKQANQTLIDTIEESLQIADEGKRRRAEAETQLRACESELRQVLAAARARAQTPPARPAG
jgi:uncharacterized protein YaaN involved in tellurite resistance